MLLNIDKNAKTVKGQKQGFMTGILYLSPSIKVCPNSTKACLKACLNTAGRGIMKNVQAGRKRKTDYYQNDRQAFLSELVKDISTLKRRARKAGLIPVIRLNGTSDIDWKDLRFDSGKFEGYNVFELFSETQFYDYTKMPLKMINNSYRNYHLTFSFSGENMESCQEMLDRELNVAYVYAADSWIDKMIKTGLSNKYINGDLHDLRFLDGKGKMILLKAKGKARKQESNFILN